MKCEECGGNVVLTPEGEYVCEKCGLVQRDLISYSAFEESKYREKGEYIGTYLFVFDAKDKSSIDNVRKMVKRNTYITFSSKMLAKRKAEKLLQKISYYIVIKEPEMKSIIKKYEKLIDAWRKESKTGSRPISNGLLAALIYAELRGQGRFMSTKDVVNAFIKAGKRISESQMLYGLYFLRKHGYMNTMRKETAIKYIHSLMIKAGLTPKEVKEAENFIQQLLEQCRKISGRRKRSLYAAIAYLAANKKRRISYREFSRKTGVPLSTLRENVVKIKTLNVVEVSAY